MMPAYDTAFAETINGLYKADRTQTLIDDLRQALDDALRRLSPMSEMAKAIAYGRKRWVALTHFLDDGLAG